MSKGAKSGGAKGGNSNGAKGGSSGGHSGATVPVANLPSTTGRPSGRGRGNATPVK